MYNAFTKPFTTSRYAKEELPVWSEIWNQFMLNKAYTYDPDNALHNLPAPDSPKPEVILNSMDIYWKQPHRKLLLGWMANELNKLSLEDGRLEEIDFEHEICLNITGLTFAVVPTGDVVPDGRPPIYTQISPTTHKRSVFASTDPSVDMADLQGSLELVIVLTSTDEDSHVIERSVLRPNDEGDLYQAILDKFLEPIRIYFEEPVGWKDADYIPKPLTRRCLNEGIDPAL